MPAVLKKSNEPIPGYKLMQRIGAGGYGEVWTAEAPGGLIKALKFVYGLLDEDRATREMKAIQRIKGVRHPFLLSIERIEVVDGQLIFVTELADNSLKDRFDQCRKEGRPGIPRDELLQHLRDTADALDYMSEHHSLQHLDVKPENLLLVGGRIKVADFGLVKDLHEGSASMMGGLTPIYAPPEVFEGRPTKHSDQYSLAIVYQEMLSGVLPFPGKTAAQLAAQHLNARPRMAALPEADQQVIGKSLSKNPSERYPNCREMVAALNKATQAIVAARMTQSRSDITHELGRHITQGATQANTSPPAPVQPAQPVTEQPLPPMSYATEAVRTPDQMLANLDEASQAADSLQASPALASSTDNLTVNLQQILCAADTAPPEFDVLNWSPQPTLIVGLGGLGGKVIGRLKRTFAEQPLGAALQLLVIDTDRREASEANMVSSGTSTCRNGEFVHVPLRKSCDYREDSRKMLEWLGRRWLYNIPRSQQTEGLRPLGRLALVDHNEVIWNSCRSALKKLAQPLPGSDQPQQPRIVVLSASGGGTGGGMVLDLVVGLRQLLDELKLKDTKASDISVILAHTTPRNAAGSQLAMANTCALLAEWQHLLHPGAQFPGDPACALKSRTIDQPPRTRLIDMGEELSNEAFELACSRLADLIALDVSTPADSFFRASEQASAGRITDQEAVVLRTAGLVRVGFTQDELATRAARRLSHELLVRWVGKPKPPESPKTSTTNRATSILPVRQTQDNTECKMKDAFLELQAQNQLRSWGLDAETLINHWIEVAGAQLGANTDRFFLDLTQAIAKESATLSPVPRWLAATTEIFGARTSEATAPGQAATVPALVQATEGALKERITATGKAVREWLLQWLDDPQQRLYASQKALSCLQGQFRAMLDQFRELRRRFAQETGSLEQYLVSLPSDWKKARANVKKSQGPDPDVAIQQFCRLRLQDFAVILAGKFIQSLQSVLSGTGDLLVDLNRELQVLVGQYDDGGEEDAGAAPVLFGQLRKLVSEQVEAGTAAQAAVLDEVLTKQVLTPFGGLLSALTGGGDYRHKLLETLEAESRKVILRLLETLDIAAVLAEGAAIDPQLAADWRTLVDQARPRWQGVTADRRLLCVLPERSQATREPQLWKQCLQATSFQQTPALIDAPGADLLLCFDVGPLSVTDLLSQLLNECPDLGEAAGRLHTRADVSWPEIVAS
ncbi:protein kinase domain-containing protein [Anatilimnocola floriformis]|uniref:protein kinase domain-containing protein n=1 Tax=Anatilimnocola floriformis TaxID=2948575 RepID=UPI0020C4D525|nr:tubulin-like doman-containing protein [Anatilimnocola floriformis]